MDDTRPPVPGSSPATFSYKSAEKKVTQPEDVLDASFFITVAKRFDHCDAR